MPNLQQHEVTAWIAGWQPGHLPDWPPAVRAIETANAVPSTMVRLGSALDDAAQADLDRLSQALRAEPLLTDMRSVLAQLGAARCIRLLHWLTETDLPECQAVLTALLQHDDDSARALRGMVDALRRTIVLDRIFAPERLAALEAACTATLKEVA